MQLKNYQKRVIKDLHDYLQQLSSGKPLSQSYKDYWDTRGVDVGPDLNDVPSYHNLLEGIPHVGFKVPTGGGKTIIAAASILPIFESFPTTRTQAVVWLVPNEPILAQTVRALQDSSHPYRQKLNADFRGRVEVYTKDELLNGQNFSPAVVTEQLTVMVLSYDSFRTRNKEGRRGYRENGALAPFLNVFGAPAHPIVDSDPTGLAQIINMLNPVVIVDEAHNARSSLSLEMLRMFNPRLVLELTATPRENANIISYVSALELKNESMIKLPVIVYNRNRRSDVISDAIDLRATLEAAAKNAEKETGDYIRPIVLFQAQAKNSENAATFEKLKVKLVEAGIPANHIAIKTSEINELKNIDLNSRHCPIRYIITVNALKEGWDAPFAYILASLANKSSSVEVEQILGRVLRLPYTRRHPNNLLNMSYVLTSSRDFKETLGYIVEGLNAAGLSARDYRIGDDALAAPLQSDDAQGGFDLSFSSSDNLSDLSKVPEQMVDADLPEISIEDDFMDINTTEISTHHVKADGAVMTGSARVKEMTRTAQKHAKEFEDVIDKETDQGDPRNSIPTELSDKISMSSMVPQHKDHALSLEIPQFFIRQVGSSLFSFGEEEWHLLEPAHLSTGFSLIGKDSTLDLSRGAEDIARVDVSSDVADQPRAYALAAEQEEFFRKHLSSLPQKGRIKACGDIIFDRVNRNDAIDSGELQTYVNHVIQSLDNSQLAVLEENPQMVASRVEDKINEFLSEYRLQKFRDGLTTGVIEVRPFFRFTETILPGKNTENVGGSLYASEAAMNSFEYSLALQLTRMDSVKWWHRNIERRGFRLNGPINHFPDFIVSTNSGKILLIELKGGHLNNPDSRRKNQLGQLWASHAGKYYLYFMVYRDNEEGPDYSVSESHFLNLLKQL